MWRHKRAEEATVMADQAKQIRVQAEQELAERRAETPRKYAVLAHWRHIREQNHFAQAIENSLRGG